MNNRPSPSMNPNALLQSQGSPHPHPNQQPQPQQGHPNAYSLAQQAQFSQLNPAFQAQVAAYQRQQAQQQQQAQHQQQQQQQQQQSPFQTQRPPPPGITGYQPGNPGVGGNGNGFPQSGYPGGAGNLGNGNQGVGSGQRSNVGVNGPGQGQGNGVGGQGGSSGASNANAGGYGSPYPQNPYGIRTGQYPPQGQPQQLQQAQSQASQSQPGGQPQPTLTPHQIYLQKQSAAFGPHGSPSSPAQGTNMSYPGYGGNQVGASSSAGGQGGQSGGQGSGFGGGNGNGNGMPPPQLQGQPNYGGTMSGAAMTSGGGGGGPSGTMNQAPQQNPYGNQSQPHPFQQPHGSSPSPSMSVRPPPQAYAQAMLGQQQQMQAQHQQHGQHQYQQPQQQYQQPPNQQQAQNSLPHRPQSAASQRSFHNPSPSPAPSQMMLPPQARNVNSPLSQPQPQPQAPSQLAHQHQPQLQAQHQQQQMQQQQQLGQQSQQSQQHPQSQSQSQPPAPSSNKKVSNPSVTGKRKAPPEPGSGPPRSHKKKVPAVTKPEDQPIGGAAGSMGGGAQPPTAPGPGGGPYPYPPGSMPPQTAAPPPTAMPGQPSQQPQLPFDPVLLPYLGMLRDPAAAQRLQHSNPQLFAEVVHVSEMMRSGAISPQAIQAMLTAQAASHAKAAQERQLQQQAQSPVDPSAGPQIPPNTAVSGIAVRPPGPASALSYPSGQLQGGPPRVSIPDVKPTVPPPPVVDPNVADWERALDRRFPITKITPISADLDEWEDPTFEGQVPALSDREAGDIRDWIDKDLEYGRSYEAQKAQIAVKMGTLRDHLTGRLRWWEKDSREPRTRRGLNLIWPAEKAAKREASRRKGKSTVKFTKVQLRAMAKQEDRLVPIRLDIEHDQWRFRDTFIWNASDTVVTPEMFAKTICEDFGLPVAVFVSKITAAITAKVVESKNMAVNVDTLGVRDDTGMDDADLERWKTVVKLGLETPLTPAYDNDDIAEKELNEQPLSVEDLMEVVGSEKLASEDLRVKIQLDIISGTMELSDNFEWDLLSPVSPEEFAEVYAADLGLNGEFKTAIVHDIREQVQNYLKSLIMTGYGFDGAPVLDIDLRNDLLPPVSEAIRKDDLASSSFTPFLNQITDADVERMEYEREKEKKKKGRGTRGRRLIALPDREPVRTNRTRIQGLDEHGQPLTMAAAPKIALQLTTPPRRAENRRAAAVAAKAHITSITAEMSQKDEEIEEKALLAVVRGRKGRFTSATPGPIDDGPTVPNPMRSALGSAGPAEPPVRPACSKCGRKVSSESDTLCEDCTRADILAQSRSSVKPEQPDIKVEKELDGQPNRGGGTERRGRTAGAPTFQTVMSPDSEDSAVPATPVQQKQDMPAPERPSQLSPVQRVPAATPNAPTWFSAWLRACRDEHPTARLESVYKGKSTPEASDNSAWRIKCLDCPGKVYTLGPGDSMQNFELHLKNRKHMENVNMRAKAERANR